MFVPKKIYYEKNIINYELGRKLLEKYKYIPKQIIESHNNIPEMRAKQNKDFVEMKKNLIIGIRKTHKFVPNYKVSNYLVPYTSSGCSAMCMYCYLVCHYNKCAYLRLFVNRKEMLEKIIKRQEKESKDLIFEIGSNSDLVLENTITGNLKWTIENFSKCKKGYLTFPTKFHMVDDILDIKGKDKVIVRMSVNPEYIVKNVEIGTSSLDKRIEAINKLCNAGYKVGILIAPVILIDNWKKLYKELIIKLRESLSEKVKEEMFFEVIFMTYSFVHKKINEEAFPGSIKIYDNNIMRGRGRGKYIYRDKEKEEGEKYIESIIKINFPNSNIVYIV